MKPSYFLIIFLAFYLKCTRAAVIIDGQLKSSNVIQPEIEDIGEPLILTPYLEKGRLDEARNKALVKHRETPGIESYSGYFTVNKEYNSNLFFWYFPAENNRENAPLILWMTGGPGSTSMLGLFAENGPFTVTVNQSVEMREYSWTRNHHMLYLDSPVDTGYSFADDDRAFAKTSGDVARDVLAFMTQFYQLFTELQSNGLYVVGESMGGKFSPPVAHAIKQHNEKADVKINMQGLLIAGGLADPVNQVKHVQYLYELGLIGENQRVELQALEDKIVNLIEGKKFVQLSIAVKKYQANIVNMTGFDYAFHLMRPQEPDWINPFIHWVVRPDVRRAMHVGNVTFERTSAKVQKYIAKDMFLSVADYIEETLASGVRVFIYTGQLDGMVTHAAMEKYISKLEWTGAPAYKAAPRKIYYVGDELAGYVKSAENLTTILIREAGHMLPNDKPVWAFDMITRFTHNQGY